jgi:hypothetical protein
MKKSVKVMHYFGLDCGMLEFIQIFFSQAVIQKTIVDFPQFWRPAFFNEAAQNFDVVSNIQN